MDVACVRGEYASLACVCVHYEFMYFDVLMYVRMYSTPRERGWNNHRFMLV
jgi:hypothetical protein